MNSLVYVMFYKLIDYNKKKVSSLSVTALADASKCSVDFHHVFGGFKATLFAPPSTYWHSISGWLYYHGLFVVFWKYVGPHTAWAIWCFDVSSLLLLIFAFNYFCDRWETWLLGLVFVFAEECPFLWLLLSLLLFLLLDLFLFFVNNFHLIFIRRYFSGTLRTLNREKWMGFRNLKGWMSFLDQSKMCLASDRFLI